MNLDVLIGFLIYYPSVMYVASLCKRKELKRLTSFAIGFLFGVFFALSIFLAANIFYENGTSLFADPLMSITLVLSLSLLAGLRCAGFFNASRT